jgi:Zn-dependent metalloprotease
MFDCRSASRRIFTPVLIAMMLLGLAAAVSPSATAAPTTSLAQKNPEPPPLTGKKLAADAAAKFVTTRPAIIRPGPFDRFIPSTPVTGVRGLQYVTYHRSYQGLPVIGGEFVVITDSLGRIMTAVPGRQRAVITIGNRAALSSVAAAKVALGRTPAAAVHSNRLVVDALINPSRLAYAVVVSGTLRGKPTRQEVLVDAGSGKILSVEDQILDGEGTGVLNGPNPIPLSTTDNGDGTFSMTDPLRPRVSCRDESGGAVFTHAQDVWGNGVRTDRETGCVDALFASQREWDMLSAWLGRSGVDGVGHGFPMYVGLNDINAFWDGSSVHIGKNTDGQWIGALDVVGHELGHGVDQFTGGMSSEDIAEGIGDVFGAMTEWYANEPAPYDVPDYTIGEQVDLVGNGPIRDMHDPSLVGDPRCYSASIPGTETHSAAGPFDHWFYLFAEGSNPSDGQPASPTCDGSTVTGVGLRDAATAFYQGLLAAAGQANYPVFRHAVLAAIASYDDSCQVFNAAQAAWDAVSVPATSGEATCTPKLKPQTITFLPPADRTYGAPDFDLSATSSSGLQVSYSSPTPDVCTIPSATVHIVGAGTCILRADQAGDIQYLPAPQLTRSFTVGKALLTLRANDLTRAFGQPNPPLTYTTTGLVNGDPPNVVTGVAALSTTATASSPSGAYPITIAPGTLAAQNYSFDLIGGTLRVQPAGVKVVAQNTSILRATYQGGVSFSATVTNLATAKPAAGDTVVFTARTFTGYTFGCTAVTTSTGVASCTAGHLLATLATLPPTFLASAQASAEYLAATATGTIKLI